MKTEWHLETQSLIKTLPGRCGRGRGGNIIKGTHVGRCAVSLGKSPWCDGGTENTGKVLGDESYREAWRQLVEDLECCVKQFGCYM